MAGWQLVTTDGSGDDKAGIAMLVNLARYKEHPELSIRALHWHLSLMRRLVTVRLFS